MNNENLIVRILAAEFCAALFAGFATYAVGPWVRVDILHAFAGANALMALFDAVRS